MEQGVTLDQVKWAMKHLQEHGERVSRRNVRSLTGGGMSTVHRLMSIAEEQESLQNGLFTNGISETFLAALKTEISVHLQSSTDNYKKQIQLLKTREEEITEALSAAEEKADSLEQELFQLKQTSGDELQELEKQRAVAEESIRRLESWIGDYKTERKEFTAAIEAARIENASSKRRIESLEQDLQQMAKQTKK